MTGNSSGAVSNGNPILTAMQGWQPARALMVANRLDVFTIIGEGRLSAEEIAERCQSYPRSMSLLLNACVALKFLQKEGNLYSNSPDALQLLIRGKPTYMGDMIAHGEDTMRTWMHLEEAVRTNRAVQGKEGHTFEGGTLSNFVLGMHNRAMATAELMAEALDLSGRHQLFDAGGGPGTYSIFLAKRYPRLNAIVFDLPPVIEIAKGMIASFDMQDRITTRAGNYFEDDFGQGNDVVLLSAILHQMGPEKCKLLLRKAYDSLVSGGIVVVSENFVSADGASPVSAALFSLNMLVHTGEGQSRSAEEVIDWMQELDFVDPLVKSLSERMSLVIGTRP